MPGIVVVGTQWGDEGKGKVTDLIGSNVDYVVRYNGGANAGHTVVVGDESYALHLLPSGIVNPAVTPIIGNGTVVDPSVLLAEIADLTARGVDCSRLLISSQAQVTAPFHRVMDSLSEKALGNGKIGTTGRGIGPTYADKINRIGIRVQDLLDRDRLRAKIEACAAPKNIVLAHYGQPPIDVDAALEELASEGEQLRPYVTDTPLVINRALDAGKAVLFEGSQAVMLDIDHGTYPFVTSSNPIAGGACTGAGVGPTKITSVVGVAKAYTTRVGEGPFPTELNDETGVWLRERGHEFGVTTGRPRRTGWFDSVVVRYAAMVNGLTDVVLTKLDALSGLPTIRVCVAYDVTHADGTHERVADMPVDQQEFASAQPIYEELEGWNEPIGGASDFAELPAAAQAYVLRLEELIGCPIAAIGTGPKRANIIVRRQLI